MIYGQLVIIKLLPPTSYVFSWFSFYLNIPILLSQFVKTIGKSTHLKPVGVNIERILVLYQSVFMVNKKS